MEENKRMEDPQDEFEKALQEWLDSIPAGRLQEEPRFILTGEIIPKSLRGDNKDMSYSELP